MKKLEFKSGVSNQSFLSDSLVVRTNADVSDNPFINRENELIVTKLCEPITTTLVEVTKDKMVTKYEQLYDYNVGEKLTKIIDLIKCMHTKKVKHVFNPFKIIDNTKLDIKFNKRKYELVKGHWLCDEFVLCHNDLLKENIIFNGKDMKLIDFEYSGMNSRYFDLASLISENNLWDLKEEIAEAYGDIDLKMLDLYIFLNDLLWTIWGTELGHDDLVADKRKRLSEY